MEEKERFELFGEHCIKDNNPDARPQLLDAYVACVILNEQDKKIKAKEKEANTYAKEIVFLDNKIKLLERENRQLKQQLAEKDKQIDYYQSLLKRSCDECNIKLKTIKTNFALEQLEKVKEKALHFYVNDAPELTSFYVDVKEIDNQIKELKGRN